jgi:hypothetical protein
VPKSEAPKREHNFKPDEPVFQYSSNFLIGTLAALIVVGTLPYEAVTLALISPIFGIGFAILFVISLVGFAHFGGFRNLKIYWMSKFGYIKTVKFFDQKFTVRSGKKFKNEYTYAQVENVTLTEVTSVAKTSVAKAITIGIKGQSEALILYSNPISPYLGVDLYTWLQQKQKSFATENLQEQDLQKQPKT